MNQLGYYYAQLLIMASTFQLDQIYQQLGWILHKVKLLKHRRNHNNRLTILTFGSILSNQHNQYIQTFAQINKTKQFFNQFFSYCLVCGIPLNVYLLAVLMYRDLKTIVHYICVLIFVIEFVGCSQLRPLLELPVKMDSLRHPLLAIQPRLVSDNLSRIKWNLMIFLEHVTVKHKAIYQFTLFGRVTRRNIFQVRLSAVTVHFHFYFASCSLSLIVQRCCRAKLAQ